MRLAWVAAAMLIPVVAECEQSYRVYTEHPRLWLDARRLRLLRREKERDSTRWQQLQLVTSGRTPLPEAPLVRALEYQVAGQDAAGREAAAWAVKRTSAAGAPDTAELRLLAVVFDWCHSLFSEADRARIAERMARGILAAARPGMEAFAARVMAAIALADDWTGSEPALTDAFEKAWRDRLLPALREGRGVERHADRVALLELCHAARDNLHIDPWSQAPVFFRQFPIYLLLEHYPAPVIVDGHPFRRPAARLGARVDPAVEGELSRRVEMLTAAYETNSNETAFLQGWITHDTFRLRSPSGAVYEFLWANPYHPGLSYYAAPLYLYDEAGGALLARSSWDDDAAWFGWLGGQAQVFADERPSAVGTIPPAAPVIFPQVAVARVAGDADFKVRVPEGNDVFVVGLEAGKTYWVKAGERKAVPQVAGRGGVIPLKLEAGAETAFQIRTTDPNPPPPSLEKKKRK